MARKRLSDLLREEVQKPAEEAPAVPLQAEAKDVANQAVPVEAPATNGQTHAIAAAQQREAELQQKITDLEAELKAETTSVKTLQTHLEKAEQHSQQLETELSEVKQTTLQLAESNSQLKQELETLKRSQTVKPVEPKAKPNPAPSSQPDGNKLAAKPLTQQEILRRQANSLAHPMFPAGNAPGQFSDQDLGWFD